MLCLLSPPPEPLSFVCSESCRREEVSSLLSVDFVALIFGSMTNRRANVLGAYGGSVHPRLQLIQSKTTLRTVCAISLVSHYSTLNSNKLKMLL